MIRQLYPFAPALGPRPSFAWTARGQTLLAVAAVALLASAASMEAKPPGSGSGGTTAPEIVYTYEGRSGWQLRVANEDGTGAVTLHSSSAPIYARLGPSGSRQIAFWEGKTLKLLTYDVTTTGVRSAGITTLTSTSGSQFNVIVDFDFSPAGTHLAWWHPDERKIYVYDLQSPGASELISTGYPVSDVTITQDGQTIIYAESIDGSFTNYSLKAVPVAGGSPTELGITGNILGVDAGHTDNKLLLTKQIVNVGRYLELVPDGATTGTRLTDGREGSLNCSDTRFVYRLPSGNKASTLIYDLGTGTSSTFSRDLSVIWVSYMPTC